MATHPNIAYTVLQLTAFMTNLDLQHWTAAKCVLRYLAGTQNLKLKYMAEKQENKSTNSFYLYSDADFTNTKDCISISRYVSMLSNAVIMWSAKKQHDVTLSTAKAEYAAMANATKEAMWLQNVFCELGFKQTEPTLIFSDNQSALAIGQSKQYHQHSKYFCLRHHYICEKVTKGAIKVQYCPTNKMIADIFTKGLPKLRHEQHVTNLRLY